MSYRCATHDSVAAVYLVIDVLHSDKESPMHKTKRPTWEELVLQGVEQDRARRAAQPSHTAQAHRDGSSNGMLGNQQTDALYNSTSSAVQNETDYGLDVMVSTMLDRSTDGPSTAGSRQVEALTEFQTTAVTEIVSVIRVSL